MRRLVAALACRVNGSRLYGKPLQALDIANGISVLDHLVALLRTEPSIAEVVLGVAEGTGNDVFQEVAKRLGIRSIIGDERDVLSRLIACGRAGGGTDVFRVTTESPFPHADAIADVWRRHVAHANDVTVIDGVPEGSHFEVFTLEALQRSHDRGNERHRSELCSLYVREHREEFQIEVVEVEPAVSRDDLRLTIDYPEDLVLCRRVYEHLREHAPRIPLERIIHFLDRSPELKTLVAPYTVPARLYDFAN
jgi:spore coat polysaccharide biosynthesis protein SpsF